MVERAIKHFESNPVDAADLKFSSATASQLGYRRGLLGKGDERAYAFLNRCARNTPKHPSHGKSARNKPPGLDPRCPAPQHLLLHLL